jgi:hypothetical protein
MRDAKVLSTEYEEALVRGSYPGQVRGGPTHLFYERYLASYVERDVSDLISFENLAAFQTFLRICATHAGQILNYNSIAKAVGISASTGKSWLGILE